MLALVVALRISEFCIANKEKLLGGAIALVINKGFEDIFLKLVD
jgi:hypothetical protein